MSLKDTKFNNNPSLNNCIAGVIAGMRNSGKTRLLLRLLLQEWEDEVTGETKRWLEYNRLYIFSPSIYQADYQLLIKGLKARLPTDAVLTLILNRNDLDEELTPDDAVKAMVEYYEQKEPDDSWKSNIEVFPYKDSNAIPSPQEVDRNYKNLFIFDDCYAEKKQSPISEYYIRGRHSNIQCFYIAQNYIKLERQTVRANANLLILFKQPMRDRQSIYSDLVSIDEDVLKPTCDFQTFKKFSNKVWDKQYEFMLIDKSEQFEPDNRYRKGFDTSYSKVMNN